jgi:hypothetical protein
LSIIKHVTLQKIVAHDFQYDPRTIGQLVADVPSGLSLTPPQETTTKKTYMYIDLQV